jgi:FixJ family two-component response regulator
LIATEKSDEKEIFVVDDDRSVRDALRIILEKAGYRVTCFADEAAFLILMRQRNPACILLDVNLPGRSGLEVLNDLASYPAPVIMISGHGNIPMAVKAIKSGAHDFIQKPIRSEELINRLETILREPSHRMITLPKAKQSSLNSPGRQILTLREIEVLEQVAVGLSSKEVGLALGISPRTVEDIRSRILRKLGVRNSAELMVTVSDRGNGTRRLGVEHSTGPDIWYVSYRTNITPRRADGERRPVRATRNFKSEAEAKKFAQEMIQEGWSATAGTLNPHTPKKTVASTQILDWIAGKN